MFISFVRYYKYVHIWISFFYYFTDVLQTVALRPPLMYGEGDNHFMPAVLRYLSNHNYKIPRIAGAGGKQQLVYVGKKMKLNICTYLNI